MIEVPQSLCDFFELPEQQTSTSTEPSTSVTSITSTTEGGGQTSTDDGTSTTMAGDDVTTPADEGTTSGSISIGPVISVVFATIAVISCL